MHLEDSEFQLTFMQMSLCLIKASANYVTAEKWCLNFSAKYFHWFLLKHSILLQHTAVRL